jgi:hypothetical protein
MRNVFLKIFIYITILYIESFQLLAQDSSSIKRLQINGYISNLQSVIFTDITQNWANENTIHNRLNFEYKLTNYFTAVIQGRNRFVYGNMLSMDSMYAANFEKDNGIMDLNVNWLHKKSFLLNSQFDRAYISFQHRKFNLTIGRQRINWGQTFVWNPNDLFNTYSYFDFDYPERPGSDAMRFEYFTGYASGLEIVAKTDSSRAFTSALLYRFNKWNNDFQVLGGLYCDNDLVLGAGWSGNIKSVGLYAELSYFKGLKSDTISNSYFYASLAANYVFPNNLQVQTEFLYASIPQGFKYSNFNDLLNRPLNVKNLAFSEYSVFFMLGYPVTPLLTANISLMWLPSLKAYYIGPNVSYSLGDNLEASLAVQNFNAKFPGNSLSELINMSYTIALLRFRYSF